MSKRSSDVHEGIGVFLPLLVVGLAMLAQERVDLNADVWRERLRFRRMTRADWQWTIGRALAVGILAAKSLVLMEFIVGHVDLQPSFLRRDSCPSQRRRLSGDRVGSALTFSGRSLADLQTTSIWICVSKITEN